MAHFVLVHGAWHGGWCWERLVPLLREAGHHATAPDLPGNGAEDRMRWMRTLGDYSLAIRKAAGEAGEPVIAVGHSLGGMSITRAAADQPERFAALVYLCAFAPSDGDRVMSMARADAESLVPGAARFGAGTIGIDRERARDAFYHRCDPETASRAAARLVAQPALPLLQRARYGKRIDGIPRAYIECSQDRAVSLAIQRRLHERMGMDRVVTLDTEHSPFYSDPEALARVLDELVGMRRVGARRGD